MYECRGLDERDEWFKSMLGIPVPNDANEDVEEIEGDSFFISVKDERAVEFEFLIRLL